MFWVEKWFHWFLYFLFVGVFWNDRDAKSLRCNDIVADREPDPWRKTCNASPSSSSSSAVCSFSMLIVICLHVCEARSHMNWVVVYCLANKRHAQKPSTASSMCIGVHINWTSLNDGILLKILEIVYHSKLTTLRCRSGHSRWRNGICIFRQQRRWFLYIVRTQDSYSSRTYQPNGMNYVLDAWTWASNFYFISFR